jgi:HAD superfamily hydrolase (TIGR01549 family)
MITNEMKKYMEGIKLIVFDFDQTLVDTLKGFKKAFTAIKQEYQQFLDKNGYSIIVEDHSAEMRETMRELDKNREYDRNNWWNPLLKQLKVTELQFTQAECKRLTKLYWDVTAANTELFPDTLEILNYLKKKKYLLGLITDNDGGFGLKKIRLAKSPLMKFFNQVVIAGDDVPEKKPHPAAFQKIAALLKIPPEACVMVGDKPFTDIAGGKSAGFHTVLVIRDVWEIKPLPDFQIHQLIELKTLL